MKERRRFNFSVFDFIYNLYCLIGWMFCCKRKRSSLFKRYKYYEYGENKYMKEFDAAYYAKSIRRLEMLVNTFMDDSERYLVNYQKNNTISLHSDYTATSDSDDEFKKAPKMISKKTKKELHSQRIEEFFSKYLKEKLTEKDYRLLHGVVSKKQMDSKCIHKQLNKFALDKKLETLGFKTFEENKEKDINENAKMKPSLMRSSTRADRDPVQPRISFSE